MNGQVIITGYTGPDGDVNIPAKIDGLPAVRIESLFYGRDHVTEATLPESLTTFAGRAFFGCGITSVKIPNQVKRIEWQAFLGSRLTSLAIGFKSQHLILLKKALSVVFLRVQITIPASRSDYRGHCER